MVVVLVSTVLVVMVVVGTALVVVVVVVVGTALVVVDVALVVVLMGTALDAALVDAMQVDAVQVDAVQVDAVQVDAVQVQVGRAGGRRVGRKARLFGFQKEKHTSNRSAILLSAYTAYCPILKLRGLDGRGGSSPIGSVRTTWLRITSYKTPAAPSRRGGWAAASKYPRLLQHSGRSLRPLSR